MTPEQIQQAFDQIGEGMFASQEHAEMTGFEGIAKNIDGDIKRLHELREEMKVMGRIISLALDTDEQADYRSAAENELKGGE